MGVPQNGWFIRENPIEVVILWSYSYSSGAFVGFDGYIRRFLQWGYPQMINGWFINVYNGKNKRIKMDERGNIW